MDTVTFIDVVLTPIGAGLGAVIGLSIGVKKQPEKFAYFEKLIVRIFVGILVAAASLAVKLI